MTFLLANLSCFVKKIQNFNGRIPKTEKMLKLWGFREFGQTLTAVWHELGT